MDLKDSSVKGGILIVHQLHEGKHQYEVENVVKYKKVAGEKMFVRRGDKLMQINGMDLQDLTPEELAQMLAEGNPMLRVHKAKRVEEHNEQTSRDEEILRPVSRESTILSFSMEMTREEEVDWGGEVGKDDGATEEEVCQAENEDNGERNDLFIVAMKKTSISVVRGRGCDTESPCEGCHGIGCSFNDIVMVAESSTVMLVPRGSSSFRKEKVELSNISIKHVATHQFLRGLCSQKTLYASPNPERITIYYYKSNIMDRSFRGMPVVLNFTDSNCFLRCSKEGERVVLQVETCEKQKLTQISKTDESALSFVFYMKSDRTKQMRFESVLHRGWFIQIVNTDSVVKLETLDGGKEEHSFLFIIQK
ncbi:interleukin-1 family member A [Xiphias gladius]|uniref:interleukin-1 family member A n=1 Tax=Xiphias gladius TaxID=8245 RepID=UPI001A982DB9|nr:interleukin-1 family member A [Xiphias gladius]